MFELQREFLVLAETRNYTAAARRLNLSQPTLSRHMAQLEWELGFRLLDRRTMTLTPSGAYYYESIQRLLADHDALVAEGQRIEAEQKGSLVIYMLPGEGFTRGIVYGAIATLRNHYPRLKPRVCVDDYANTDLEAVEQGLADVALVYDKASDTPKELVYEGLVRVPLCVWVRDDSPLAALPAVTWEDLEGTSVVSATHRQTRLLLDATLRLLRDHGVNAPVRMKDMYDYTDYYACLEADEMLFLPARAQAITQFNPRLVSRPFAGEAPWFTVSLLRRKDADSLVKEYVRACRDEVARLLEGEGGEDLAGYVALDSLS